MVNYLWAAILVLANTAWLALDLVGLPGNWLIIVGTLLVAWLRPGMFGFWTLVAAVALAAAGEVLELFSGVWGAQKGGAGRRGSAGALLGGLIGAIMGTFLFPVPVFGSRLTPFVDARSSGWVPAR